MISDFQVRMKNPAFTRQNLLLHKDVKKTTASGKARCCFFGCQDDAVMGGMCHWHTDKKNTKANRPPLLHNGGFCE